VITAFCASEKKGGKDREIPAHHDLAAWLNEYMAAAGIAEEPKAPLFRAADGKRRALIDSAYTAHSMRQMMKRRLEAGLSHLFSPHSLCVIVVTDLLD
jgi:integrase